MYSHGMRSLLFRVEGNDYTGTIRTD